MTRLPTLCRIAALTALALPALAAPALANEPSLPQDYNPSLSVAPLFEAVVPTVVSIEVEEEVPNDIPIEMYPLFREYFAGGGHGPGGSVVTSEGSGFIISADGLVLTNHHVAAHSRKLKVSFSDGSYVNAVLLGSDVDLDVALLQLPVNREWPYVKMGDSQNMRVGDWVLAVGNGLGLGHTATVGIISGTARPSEFSAWQEFLQTDAAINEGNSGGPLFNLKGEVIGINTAIISGANTVGFAVPIDMVKPHIDDLKTQGRILRGFMGVTTEALTRASAQELGVDADHGALVTSVSPDTPAQRAGLRQGDIIVKIDDVAVPDSITLGRTISQLKPGHTVNLLVLRKGTTRTVSATLVDRDLWTQSVE